MFYVCLSYGRFSCVYCDIVGLTDNAVRIVFKTPFWRPRSRLQNNIKMALKEITSACGRFKQPPQNALKCPAIAKIAIDIRVTQKREFSELMTFSFSVSQLVALGFCKNIILFKKFLYSPPSFA